MDTTEFEAIVREVLASEFFTLEWCLYHDAHRRIEFDTDCLSVVVRIADSGVQYYLCIAVSVEYQEDTPTDELPIKTRAFVREVISKFSPNSYSVLIDGNSCELWMLRHRH